jgi:hypothetical protein
MVAPVAGCSHHPQIVRHATDASADTAAADVKTLLDAIIDSYYKTITSGRRAD